MITVKSSSVETNGANGEVAAEFMSLVKKLRDEIGESEVRNIFEFAIGE
jgi:hypothetical protein